MKETLELNRTEAFKAMLSGKTVRGIDGAFFRHVEHGGLQLFRFNFESQHFEAKYWENDEFRIMRSAIYLFRRFVIYED